MKIIHVVDSLGGMGGVNSFVYDLCMSMKIQGVDVNLIGILDSKDNDQVTRLRELGIRVICLGAPNKKAAVLCYYFKLRKIIKMLAQEEKTVCNLHLKLSVLLGAVATIGLKNIKCVETYHSQYRHYELEYNLLKRRIEMYIPCSKSAANEMKQRFHVKDDKLFTILNGINCEAFSRKIGNVNENIMILSAGRLTEQKNFSIMVEAMNGLQIENLQYNIIGKGEDEKELKNNVRNSNIHFLGEMSREEVIKYTSNAELVCMPSLWEGLSIYMMEAFALGRPMILSDIPSFREAVEESELINEKYRKCDWGYLVKVDDVLAYRLALSDFAKHKEQWEAMQAASYEISGKFDISNTVRLYLEAYEQVWCIR